MVKPWKESQSKHGIENTFSQEISPSLLIEFAWLNELVLLLFQKYSLPHPEIQSYRKAAKSPSWHSTALPTPHLHTNDIF